MPPRSAHVVPHLTPKEREVLSRLPFQSSAQEIAEDTYVSVNTVRSHIKNIYVKLGVNRRTDAVRQAQALHLLPGRQLGLANDPEKARVQGRLGSAGEPDLLRVDGFDQATSDLVRIGALIAIDSPASSFQYLFENGDAVRNLERCVATLVAIAPVIGSVRVGSAATSVLEAYSGAVRDLPAARSFAR